MIKKTALQSLKYSHLFLFLTRQLYWMYFYRKLQQTNKRFTRLLKDLGKPLLYMYVNIWFTDLCFYRGVPAGEENGRRGYLFTFVVAYIRVRCHSHSSCMRTLSCNVCQKL